MAMRSGSGVGVLVALIVFVISTVALLVLTIVFYAGKADAIEQESMARTDLDEFITREQRNRDSTK